MAAVLVPLLALTPSCAAPHREVQLRVDGGETLVHVAERGGQPIEIPEPELWESFRQAAREVVVRPDPLAAAEEAFELAEGSGTYRFYARSGLLVPETLRELEEVENAAERMTREYREWCGGTRMGSGDCLHLLAHSKALTLHASPNPGRGHPAWSADARSTSRSRGDQNCSGDRRERYFENA